MKIIIDGQDLFTLTETQKNVIKNDISADIFEEDIKRRVMWVIRHKYDMSMKRLKEEWEPKIKGRGANVPTTDEEFAQLVFRQPDYKDRKKRNADISNS